MRSVFIGPLGLRSGWRIAIFCLAVTAAILGWNFAAWALIPDLFSGPTAALIPLTASNLIPTLAISWLCARLIDQDGLKAVGLDGGPLKAIAEVAAGAALGIGLIAASWGIVALLGGASIAWKSPDLLSFLLWSAILLAAATWEEVLFRGYAFGWLRKGIGRWGATGLCAAIFTAAHLTNPNITAIGALSIGLASAMLCLSRFLAGDRLWWPIGLHWGWNFAQGMLFGVAISGIDDGDGTIPAMARSTLSGPDWLTGGDFGFEGSAGTVGLLIVACVLLIVALRAHPRTPGPDA